MRIYRYSFRFPLDIYFLLPAFEILLSFGCVTHLCVLFTIQLFASSPTLRSESDIYRLTSISFSGGRRSGALYFLFNNIITTSTFVYCLTSLERLKLT